MTLLKMGTKYLKRNGSFEHSLHHPLLSVAVTTNQHWKLSASKEITLP